jgi:hypothetical protein
MRILRLPDDPTRTPGEASRPPTRLNTESHWWDASQVYGSDQAFQAMVRVQPASPGARTLGKLVVGPDGLIPLAPDDRVQPAAAAGWWLGMAMMHTLFHLEHNAVCDHLHAAYPSWSDDELFEHARLVIAALLAKIHTVEWTPAILGHPALQIGMRANWWGIAEERIYKLLGRISESEVISGIPGSRTDHFGVPYSITEEFTAVYRMHPLIPDDYDFRAVADDAPLPDGTLGFRQIAGQYAQDVLKRFGMKDLLYSFGTSHPGAITLHNYPHFLQEFERPDGFLMDLAATDILRIRELGVPRYNQFRQLLHLPRVESFEALTDNREWSNQLRRVYHDDIDRVDLMIGLFAERFPKGFGFSDTAFRIFILMASRRLNSDRFFTTDYNPRVYSQAGFDWINQNDMSTVLLRHYPALAPALRNVKNSFAPWNRAAAPQ